MYSHLKWITIAGVLFWGLFQGCTNDNPISSVPENSEEQIALAKKLPNSSHKNRAIKKATEFLSSEGVVQTNSNWAAFAKVVDAFPIYMDGIDDVCYYECKVQANGTDAGYILVNINKTDVQFPSYSTEGKTATEEFSTELRRRQ